jgi:hypothetical protein
MSNLARERRRGARHPYSHEDDPKGRFTSFAVSRSKRPIHPTNIVDLSVTGIAFLIEGDSAPRIGEKIGVEFIAPNSKRMACFGYAVRLETYNSYSNLVKVGVEFIELPLPYHRIIKNSVEEAATTRGALHNLKESGTSVVVDIKSSRMSWKQIALRIGMTMLAAVGAVYFVLQMQKIAETEWWVPEAIKFQQEVNGN